MSMPRKKKPVSRKKAIKTVSKALGSPKKKTAVGTAFDKRFKKKKKSVLAKVKSVFKRKPKGVKVRGSKKRINF